MISGSSLRGFRRKICAEVTGGLGPTPCIVACCLLWLLWKQRCAIVFHNSTPDVDAILRDLYSTLAQWDKAILHCKYRMNIMKSDRLLSTDLVSQSFVRLGNTPIL